MRRHREVAKKREGLFIMSSWSFPGNHDGQIKGVADAGIENFNGNELASLVRENCQNSLDAAENEDNPNVLVVFERTYIPSAQVPGLLEYRKILEKCKDFWDKSGSEKAKDFLSLAISKVNAENISVLRISDYNTIGLAKPYCDINDISEYNFDGWNALIKIDGGANKGDDKAGAYGIGKSAPFSNSYYRMVFYRTLNKDNERASQGVSRLMSYKEIGKIGEAYFTSGVGYYGNSNGNNPVESIPELEALNKRNSTGTDVFIYGFKDRNQLESDIIISLLDNFLMSLYYGHLSVKLQNKLINKENLSNIIENINKKRPKDIINAYGNFLVLTRSDGVHCFEKKFHGLGVLHLRILVDPNEKLDRKVLIVRKAGMKLFRLSRISKLVPFTGILELKGKELNSYFRKMETVAHDNWEPGRHPIPEQAKEYFEEIKEWIRGVVSNLAEHSSEDEINVEGLNGVLQTEIETDKNNDDSDDKKEILNDFLRKQPEIIERPSKLPSKGFFYGRGNFGHKEIEQTSGTLGKDGESGLRILKGKRQRKKIVSHKGRVDFNGRDIVNKQKSGGEKNEPLKTVRIIKQGGGKYSVVFQLEHSISSGHVELVTIGENGKSNKLRIVDAIASAGCSNAIVKEDNIEISDAIASEKIRIIVTLADNSHDYAMELNVYEHN